MNCAMDVERTTNTSATTEANQSEFEDTENEINAGVTAMESRGDEHYIYQNESNNGLPVLYENSGALLAAPASDAGTGDTCVEGNGENEIMSDETRQTITLNLDAATQYLLQQHGITTQTIEMDDGTYQLFDQPVIQVQREDGTLEAQTLHVEVLQALQGELVQQLQPTLDVGYPLAGPVDGEEATEAQPKIDENTIAKEAVGGDCGSKGDDKEESQDSTSQPHESDDVLKDLKEEIAHCASQQSEKVHDSQESEQISTGTTTDKMEVNSKKEPSREEADFTNPIPLSNQAVITVKGKKCVLSYDAKTQQVCAYPIKSKTGKPRGRPRLTEAEKVAARQRKIQQQMEAAARVSSISTPSEQSSAAETLLELSNTGLGGIRRSGRARKKTKVLDDFEELEDSEEEEGPAFEDNHEKDPDISIDLPEIKRRRLLIPGKEALPAHGTRTVAGPPVPAVKRGRGRPRRYPPPGHQNAPKSIPAVMLPSADGQTFVMAPIQELQNLRRQLPHLVPKPPEQGTEVIPTSTAQADGSDSQNLVLECSDADSLPLDAAGVLDSSNIIPQALQGDNIPLIGDTVDSSDQGNGLDTSPASLLNLITHTTAEADKNKSDMSDSQQQPTVIQIPDNILASLGFKKDPVKIGLKASERELEKLKCPKCDFQGYYAQQYRNHIASHGDDIQKCKCCSFLSLDTEELLQHFKENHPRCICPECGYMAEHAYIIKRHMMRHDVKSCTCNICGKVYKDMYILKMHIKMVHMPAEVLFECDVCSKKFTRKAHLKRHMRIHEPEKPFKCSLCDYRGCERSDISKHMLIHQEPKHACERCGKTFRHIKNKELHVKRHYGQRDYKCGVCDFFGYTFTDIRKHIERKHQDIKTLTCDKCGRHFRNDMALKEHMQSCNVMMIEQVLAIPTSGGRTSQATIRIPTHHLSSDLSSLGGMVALDPAGTAGLVGDGNVADGAKDATQGVSIMVTSSTGDQHLRIVQTAMDEDEDEEEDLEEEEDQEENGDGSSMQQAMHIMDGTIMKEGVGVQHMLGKGTPQLIASNSNIDLTQTHQIEQDQHYVVAASDIHLISCSSDTATATSIITTAGEGCQEHQGDAVLATKYEDSLDGRVKEEIPGEGHITSVEGGSGAIKVEGKPEALVSMAEWSATSQERAFSNTDNSQEQQDQLLVS